MEYDVLGCRVKVDTSQDDGDANPDEVVEAFRQEAQKIQNARPNLDTGQVAILVALKFVSEKMTLEGEYRESVEQLEAKATDALHFLEKVSPEHVPEHI